MGYQPGCTLAFWVCFNNKDDQKLLLAHTHISLVSTGHTQEHFWSNRNFSSGSVSSYLTNEQLYKRLSQAASLGNVMNALHYWL